MEIRSSLTSSRRLLTALSAILVACNAIGPATAAPQVLKQRIPTFRSPALKAQQLPPETIPGQIVVLMHKGAQKDSVSKALEDVNGRVIETSADDVGNVYALVQVDKQDAKYLKACQTLAKNKKNFDIVEPNRTFHRCAWPTDGKPNDPDFPLGGQPQLNVHDAIFAHHLLAKKGVNLTSAGGPGVTIGIIDTGVESFENSGSGTGNIKTDFFLTQVLPGFNTGTRTNTGDNDTDIGVTEFAGHGTFCAGIMAAATDNFYNGASFLPGARINPVDVFSDSSGMPTPGTTTFNIVTAIQFLQKSKVVRFINLSVNAPPPFSLNGDAAYMTAASTFFHVRNGTIFNAAGNEFLEDHTPPFPSNIVVSAVDSTRSLSVFSNYGRAVTVAGLGVNDGSTLATGHFVNGDGTSFACPSVCAIAASIAAANPGLSVLGVLQVLLHNTIAGNPQQGINNGVPSGTNQFGAGVPDAGWCVRAASGSHAAHH